MDDNGFFEKLFVSINRLFTQEEILFRPVTGKINAWLYLAHEVECNGEYTMMNFTMAGVPVYIIRSPKDDYIETMMLSGDTPVIVFVVPTYVSAKNFEFDYQLHNTIHYIDSICNYLCNYAANKFAVNGTVLNRVFQDAPSILLINLITSLYNPFMNDVEYYLDGKAAFGPISKPKWDLHGVLSYTIADLLDNGAILTATNVLKKKNK